MLRTLKKLIFIISFLFFASNLLSVSQTGAQELQPYSANKRYWQYKGEPVLLLGGFNSAHNVFFVADVSNPLGNLTALMDEMVNNGGNVMRCVFDPGMAAADGFITSHQKSGGKYDLNLFTSGSNSYWGKFETLLSEADTRNIIVQVEVWDRFDWQREKWDHSPFRPANNNNYTTSQSGLADSYLSYRDNPFAHGVPGHPAYESASSSRKAQYDLVRGFQEQYIRHLLSISLQYDNVLYTMNNETEEEVQWGHYWLDFIKTEADAVGKTVFMTDMFEEGAYMQSSTKYAQAFANPNKYTYLDISQNNAMQTTGGPQAHWDNLMYVRNETANSIRPINNTKVYGSDNFVPIESWHFNNYERYGDLAAQNSFWMNLIGGCASARYHRPTAGMGINDRAKASLRAARKLETKMKMWELNPRNDLMSNRGTVAVSVTEYNFVHEPFVYGEAYLAAKPGQKYALYFTNGGSVNLNLDAYTGVNFDLNWINIDTGNWGSSTTISGGDSVKIDAPESSAWLAAIVRSSEGSASLTVQPAAADTYIRDGASSGNNHGTQTSIWLKNANADYQTRGILAFDFSTLDDSAVIESAYLDLYYFDNDIGIDPVGETVEVNRLTRTDWVEEEVTWNDYKNATPWTSAGGDFTVTDQATAIMPAAFGWVRWTVTDLVKYAQGNTSEIVNLLLKFATTPGVGARFYSKEYTTDPSKQPKLIINYTTNVDALSVSIAEVSISENGGSSQATLSRNSGTSGNLLVDLTSSDVAEATVPATVTIPNGSDFTTFTVTGVDDTIVDGTKTVTITASATGFTLGNDIIDVTDDEVAALSVSITEVSISENGGSSQATVTRNSGTAGNLLVTLSSSDVTEATVPATVTIPIGSASTTFTVMGVVDAIVDGMQTVTITASAIGFTSGNDTIVVTDGDVATLSVLINQNSILENGDSSQATVSRNNGTFGNLLVNLGSSDVTEAMVPATVTIPNGSDFTTFTVTGVADAIVDGTQTVTITASAAGHAAGNDTIDVTDVDGTGPISLTVQPSAADTFMRDGASSNNNFGTQTSIWLKKSIVCYNRRGILGFDFTALDDSAVIESAYLDLYYFDNSIGVNPVGETVEVNRVTQTDWVEGEATWNNYKSATPWTTAGGDYTVTDQATAVMPAAYGWVRWTVTDQVKYAQSNTSEIANLLVKFVSSASSNVGARFYTKEFTTDQSKQPKLIINYSRACCIK